MPNLNKDH